MRTLLPPVRCNLSRPWSSDVFNPSVWLKNLFSFAMSGAANPLNALLFSNMIFLPQYPSFCVTPLVPKYYFLEVQHSRIISRSRCMLTSKMDGGRRSVFSGFSQLSTINDMVHCHYARRSLKSYACPSFTVSLTTNGNAADTSRICSPIAQTLSRACRRDRWRVTLDLCAVSSSM